MRTEAAIKNFQVKLRKHLSEFPPETLEGMAEAGHEIVNIHRLLTKTSANVVGELIKEHETFYEWDHYPPGDVYDRETHAQYYYHAHVPDQRFKGEHGHFHTFLRPKGMPKEIKPAEIPGVEMPEDPNDQLSHLVAVAMTPAGLPFRLFTVNRWVTGEVWYKAEDVARFLDYFLIDHTWPSWPVNRWISALIPLFKPQILELLEARDKSVAAWAKGKLDNEVFEDRKLEVTSYIDINIEKQVQEIGRELLKRS
jgi:hypothetical protein